MALTETLIGDTVDITWISSGTDPSQITAEVRDKTETLVMSATAMTSSGGGHFFAKFTLPNSRGLYAAKVTAWVNSSPYHRVTLIKGVTGEVD